MKKKINYTQTEYKMSNGLSWWKSLKDEKYNPMYTEDNFMGKIKFHI